MPSCNVHRWSLCRSILVTVSYSLPDVFFFCVDETEAAEKKEALKEERVSLPKLRPPYAQIPSSASTKLKTVYEALASQQSLMTEELYESSPESSSPFRSLEGRYQRTRVVYL